MQLIKTETKIKEYIQVGNCEYRRDETFDENGKSLSICWNLRYPSGFSRLGNGDIGNLKLNENYLVLLREKKLNKILQ